MWGTQYPGTNSDSGHHLRIIFALNRRTDEEKFPRKILVIFWGVIARGAALGAGFRSFGCAFRTPFFHCNFALVRAAGNAGGSDELRGDDHVDGARHHAVGTAGDVVADVLGRGKWRHGVAIGFMARR